MIKRIFISLTLLTLAACGGGGGGGGTPIVPTPTTRTTATLKVSLSGNLPANTAIAGAGFTLTLPADVTPAMANNTVADGVVTPSGTFAGGATIAPVYTPATATTPATVQVGLANAAPDGITQLGEVATITLQLNNGAAPVTDAFTLDPVVNVVDVSGNMITGMQAVVTELTLR